MKTQQDYIKMVNDWNNHLRLSGEIYKMVDFADKQNKYGGAVQCLYRCLTTAYTIGILGMKPISNLRDKNIDNKDVCDEIDKLIETSNDMLRKIKTLNAKIRRKHGGSL